MAARGGLEPALGPPREAPFGRPAAQAPARGIVELPSVARHRHDRARCPELRVMDQGSSWRLIYRSTLMPSSSWSSFARRPGPRPLRWWTHAGGVYERTTACESEAINSMRDSVKARLESAGWRVGNAADFAGLTPGEAAFVNCGWISRCIFASCAGRTRGRSQRWPRSSARANPGWRK